MGERASRGERRERGTVMVIVAFAAVALLLFAGFAVDVGLVWASRTQSQAVADAASLAAAGVMVDSSGSFARPGLATAAAQNNARDNSAVGNSQIELAAADVELGCWDPIARQLDTGVDTNDASQLTGVRVTVRMDDDLNSSSPAVFTRLLGRQGFDVSSQATAYLGFQGNFDVGEFDLPIAIDACDLQTDPDTCGSDFCDTVASPPNPCAFGGETVSCLDFDPAPTLNACWTKFSPDDPSIDPGDLARAIDEGNWEQGFSAGDEIYLENSSKVPPAEASDAIDEISNELGPVGPWVVKLPVVECQDTSLCTGGPHAIVGAVCFQIVDLVSNPSGPNEIRGRFLCPSNPADRDLFLLFCADSPGAPPDVAGGRDFGFRADHARLVE